MAKKSEPSFKDLLKQLVKSNEALSRIEKSSDSTMKKLKQPLKVDDKRDAKVDQLSAKTVETPKITVENKIEVPEICVDNKIETPKIEVPEIKVPKIETPKIEVTTKIETPKIEVPEIKVPKITVDVLVDSSKKKTKKEDKRDPLVQSVAGLNFIANQNDFIGQQLRNIYLEIQSVRTLLEAAAGTIIPNFGKLVKGVEKIGKPAKVVRAAPPTIKESLVGAARSITANAIGKIVPSILGTGETKKTAAQPKGKARVEKVTKIEQTKAAKEQVPAGPLDRIAEAAKGIGAKAARGVEKILGGLSQSVAMFGEKKTVQGSKALLMLAGSLLAVASSLVLFNKVKISSFIKAIAAMTGLVMLAKFVSAMKKTVTEGAKTILMLSGALLATAIGLKLFADVQWTAIAKAGLALLALVGIAKVIAAMGSDIKSGAQTILMLGASLLAASLGLLLFAYVDWTAILKAGASMLGLVALAKAVGDMPEALVGALAIGVISASLLVAAGALLLFASVDWSSIIKAGVALVAFAGIAAVIGTPEIAGLILLGSIAIAALGAAMLVAAAGIAVFGTLDWDKVGEGAIQLAKLSLVIAPLGLLAPLLIVASAGLIALGGALLVFGAGAIIAGKGIDKLGTGFEKFAAGLEKIGKIKASELLGTAAAIGVLGASIAGFAIGNTIAGIANLVTGLLSIGRDSPIEQLEKLSATGDGLQKAADGMNALANAMARFADISPDSLKALNDFPWLKAAAFAAAGGVVSIRNVQVSSDKNVDQQSNMRLVTPQDNVETSNLTGATMVQYQKQTDEMTAQAAVPPVIVAGGGGGSSANVTSASVSNVTYNSNNIPDRTVNYLTPAYGF